MRSNTTPAQSTRALTGEPLLVTRAGAPFSGRPIRARSRLPYRTAKEKTPLDSSAVPQPDAFDQNVRKATPWRTLGLNPMALCCASNVNPDSASRPAQLAIDRA